MKTKILALLFLIVLVGVQVQFVAYAAEPPSIGSPLADDDSDTTPPALGGDVVDTTDAGSGSGSSSGEGSPPLLPEGDAGDSTAEVDSGTAAVADAPAGSTNIISETGPGVAFLLIPSLILGYAYKKMPKK